MTQLQHLEQYNYEITLILKELLQKTNEASFRLGENAGYEEGYTEGYEDGFGDGYEFGAKDCYEKLISAIAEGTQKGSSKCAKHLAEHRWASEKEEYMEPLVVTFGRS
ncbi:FliH/SctL family protein [Paenibacillus alginolyticus]|uniref:Essential protein Yae1 N-terminal domain-containing protein n=1 Tax=Paenibacillus alginolyticus TaxID=59839 RepID=A0ABT4GJR4_9BACL|nr:hypothetical protein [Paenibacillus alginolyticus]MCY9696443.1 hypothetical protein [Paenibacillus alginolyticus]MEC0145274.1 hypothetical protein [Paenibacillus alginolyticus]